MDASKGIKWGDTILRDQDLQISVEKIHVRPKLPDRRFGLIEEGCHIELMCRMTRVEIWKQLRTDGGSDGYLWKLTEGRTRSESRPLYLLYLDSPELDFGAETGAGRHLRKTFCVPTHKDSEDYLVCLLLEFVK